MIRAFFRLLALLMLGYALGFVAFAAWLPGPAGDERTQAIVVLTGGSGRLDRGFDLLRRGLSERMLISGVDRRVRARELAAVLRVEPRLIACCVDLGRESFDTRSNADEVTWWMRARGYRSMRLVTNDLHMPRARYEVRRRIGPDIEIVTDAVPTESPLDAVFIEYNKYLLGRVADLIGF